MTNKMKLEAVKKDMPDISKTKAQKIVRFLNWQTKWDDVLKIMFKNYQIDMGDKEMPYTGFALFIYENDKNLPIEYIEGIAAAN